jgi:KUP system potassium uptake protein
MSQKASIPTHPDSTLPVGRSGLAALGLAALGIVFGDIGTSPLYTLKTVLSMTRGTPTPDVVLGVLSLIVWTLIIITSWTAQMAGSSVYRDGAKLRTRQRLLPPAER